MRILTQLSSPGPVGAVFAAYSPRCDVHRGVHTQIWFPTRGNPILLRSENALHLRSAFLTAPDLSQQVTRNTKMWNTVILPIITSMTATGLGILLVWVFSRKRQSDERANQIAHIMNEISDIRNKVANSVERSILETEKNEKLRQDVKEEVEKIKQDVEKINGDVEKINTQVSEHTNLIQRLIGVVGDLQSMVRDNISRQS